VHRLWPQLIRPLLERLEPRTVVEVGVAAGENTRNLLAFCHARGAVLHAVDPEPQFDVDAVAAAFPDAFVFHRARSLDALPGLTQIDAVLIDGDHNWYTVFHELLALEETAGDAYPLVLLHDVGWPYGRRDLYYRPDDIPALYRQPHAKTGLRPPGTDLPPVLNADLDNALEEGRPLSGVLTAVEDFLARSHVALELTIVPGLHGLGILAPASRLDGRPALREFVDGLCSVPGLLDQLEEVERHRIVAETLSLSHEAAAEPPGDDSSSAEVATVDVVQHAVEQAVTQIRADTEELRNLLGELRDRQRTSAMSQAVAEQRLSALQAQLDGRTTAEDRLEGRLDAVVDELDYERLVRQVREAVAAAVPEGATVAVVSRGDDDLTRLGGRTGWHFPRDDDGGHSGHHPADTNEALAHVEELRRLGARFLVFPRTELWWLDHYRGLRRELAERYDLVETSQSCLVYRLARTRRRAAHRSTKVAGTRGERYAELVRQIRMITTAATSRDETVAIVSRGDEELVALPGRRGRHFPAAADGGYAGHYPADDTEALAELEAALAAGARLIAFPATSSWWLSHYEGLRTQLELRHPCLWRDERCTIFELRRAPAPRRLVRAARLRRLRRRLPPLPHLSQHVLPAASTMAPDAVEAALPSVRPQPLERHQALVDVVVCVHDALDDTRACLESVLAHSRPPYAVTIVDDGSGPETSDYLRTFAAEHGATLIRNDTALGYTRAANQGLLASKGDYVLLLNSDAVVTEDWLDRLVQCAESDSSIGLVGPLSNAATWQSVPEIVRDGVFAVNELPPTWTPNDLAREIARTSARTYPRVAFLNGFCLLVRRRVLDELGVFDEEEFGRGYGEENDYCVRARAAGWQLAVADDAYVFHGETRSYAPARKVELHRRAHEALLAKHGQELVEQGTDDLRRNRVLEGIRARVAVLPARAELVERGRADWGGRLIAFVLPADHGSGGANIVLQEAAAMARMGVGVNIVNFERYRAGFEASYPENRLPVVYLQDAAEIPGAVGRYDAVCATWCASVGWLDPLPANGRRPVRAYYIQDFEPYFFDPGSAGFRMAWESYTRFPDLVRVSKTEWNRRELLARVAAESAVAEPTVDIDLYRPRRLRGPAWPERPLRVLAMIRPSTPRRAPRLTMEVLQALRREVGPAVEILLFGCDAGDPQFGDLPLDFAWRNLGILNRLQVAGLMNEVDVFVDFSEFQAMGLTAMEAMSSGAAVVVPQRGGAVTYAEHERNALVVDTTSFEACFDAARRLVVEAELRSTLQRNAVRDVCSYYPERGAYNLLAAIFADRSPPARGEASADRLTDAASSLARR
jgi:GT2 family glycosyltransferase